MDELVFGRGSARGATGGKGLAAGIALIAVAGGVFWSAAYVNGVYRGEHTWITASRWIYENVPEGSVILWELWDDPLPKTIPGEPGMDMGSRGLRNIDWSPYEEDTAAKYEMLKAKLREADYVAYSSKRIYDSVDELPARYPMTTRYYDAMWDGSLGYELAFEATSPPELFGMVFDDRHADESWSLYDHPQATVFRKVRDLSDAEFDAVLGGTWEAGHSVRYGRDLCDGAASGVAGSARRARRGVLRRVGRADATGVGGEGGGCCGRGGCATAGSAPGRTARCGRLSLEHVGERATAGRRCCVVACAVSAGLGDLADLFSAVRFIPGQRLLPEPDGGMAGGGMVAVVFGELGVLHNSVRNAWLAVIVLAVAGGVVAYRHAWPVVDVRARALAAIAGGRSARAGRVRRPFS